MVVVGFVGEMKLETLHFVVLVVLSASFFVSGQISPVKENVAENFDPNFSSSLANMAEPESVFVARDLKKAAKLKKAVAVVEKSSPALQYVPLSGSPPHNVKGPAVFAAAFYTNLGGYGAKNFATTLRNTGYDGDIVIATLPNALPKFVEALNNSKVITYAIDLECTGVAYSTVCNFKQMPIGVHVPHNMLRYYLYNMWALKYESDAKILLADFRDVFFQSNPFTYRPREWSPPLAHLVVFQENYPLKVIYRCRLNRGWIETCYGTPALQKIGSNTALTSGTIMGTRDAVAVYVRSPPTTIVLCCFFCLLNSCGRPFKVDLSSQPCVVFPLPPLLLFFPRVSPHQQSLVLVLYDDSAVVAARSVRIRYQSHQPPVYLLRHGPGLPQLARVLRPAGPVHEFKDIPTG